MFGPLRELDAQQWKAFIAAFLGWTLDAFDFFMVTFVVSRIATDFKRRDSRGRVRDHDHADAAPARRLDLRPVRGPLRTALSVDGVGR